jgi:predicted esterase
MNNSSCGLAMKQVSVLSLLFICNCACQEDTPDGISLLQVGYSLKNQTPIILNDVAKSPSGKIRCSVNGDDDGQIVKFSDGTQDRCIAIIAPTSSVRDEPANKLPVLFWFHASRGDASECDQRPLASIAKQNGFALVCGEAVQYETVEDDVQKHLFEGGYWNIPTVINDTTGTPCADSDTFDRLYVKNALAELEKLKRFDTTRTFFAGCSRGAAFATYTSICHKQAPETAAHISAFATHSTGLKVKGDGIQFQNGQGKYVESCETCQYYPAKPFAVPATDTLGLKACIFDNTNDRLPKSAQSPFYYYSSRQLASYWTMLGNKAETHFGSGGHCEHIPYSQVARCLDDGTGRLLNEPGQVSSEEYLGTLLR